MSNFIVIFIGVATFMSMLMTTIWTRSSLLNIALKLVWFGLSISGSFILLTHYGIL